MYPELFRIGQLTIYTHGVLAVLGIILGSFFIFILAKNAKLNTAFLFDNIIYSVLVGVIGARITYFFLYRDQFKSLSEILYLWQGGMVSYGGFIPGILTFILLLRYQKENISRWLAISSIAFPAGLFLGRIGNIFAGEYAGIPTAGRFNLDGYIPVNLLEAILLLVIFFAMLILYKKTSKLLDKYLFAIFALSYTAGRFIIDFWRDEKDIIFKLSVGQITGLAIFLLMLAYVLKISRRRVHETT